MRLLKNIIILFAKLACSTCKYKQVIGMLEIISVEKITGQVHVHVGEYDRY